MHSILTNEMSKNISPVTQAQIAEACGVNAMLVSRVMTNHPSVAPVTRHIILQTAKRMGFGCHGCGALVVLRVAFQSGHHLQPNGSVLRFCCPECLVTFLNANKPEGYSDVVQLQQFPEKPVAVKPPSMKVAVSAPHSVALPSYTSVYRLEEAMP